jgi:hypothetical protein
MDTLMVPRIVSRALRGTSGITSLMGDRDATDFASVDLGSTAGAFVSDVSVEGFGSGWSLTTGAAWPGTGTGAGD